MKPGLSPERPVGLQPDYEASEPVEIQIVVLPRGDQTLPDDLGPQELSSEVNHRIARNRGPERFVRETLRTVSGPVVHHRIVRLIRRRLVWEDPVTALIPTRELAVPTR
jgi:hypothetical protein